MIDYQKVHKVKKRFDAVAGNFEYNTQASKLRAHYIKKYLPLDAKILDAGIGDGNLTYRYVTNQNIIGIDLSTNMLKIAKQIPHAKLVSGDGQCMPFKGETFDCVVSSETLYYATDFLDFLGEIYRVIKKKGRIIVISRNELWHFFDGARKLLNLGRVDGLNYRAFYLDELKKTLKEAGFKNIDGYGIGVFPVQGFEFLDNYSFLKRAGHMIFATGIKG